MNRDGVLTMLALIATVVTGIALAVRYHPLRGISLGASVFALRWACEELLKVATTIHQHYFMSGADRMIIELDAAIGKTPKTPVAWLRMSTFIGLGFVAATCELIYLFWQV